MKFSKIYGAISKFFSVIIIGFFGLFLLLFSANFYQIIKKHAVYRGGPSDRSPSFSMSPQISTYPTYWSPFGPSFHSDRKESYSVKCETTGRNVLMDVPFDRFSGFVVADKEVLHRNFYAKIFPEKGIYFVSDNENYASENRTGYGANVSVFSKIEGGEDDFFCLDGAAQEFPLKGEQIRFYCQLSFSPITKEFVYLRSLPAPATEKDKKSLRFILYQGFCKNNP